MKRIRFLVLTAAVLAALFAAPLSAAEKDTLIYSWTSIVGDLNPHMYSPNQIFGQTMVYEPLVQYGDDGTIQPCLAESWEISGDGRTYLFHLRKGVVFSDGEPWNAEAAKKNFDAIMGNARRHAWLGFTEQYEGTEVVAEHTLKLTLRNAYYPALHDLATPRPIRFLSPAAFPEDGDTSKGILKAVGTGPWVLTESKKAEYDLFTRNEKYWGKKPAFEKILVKVITDSDARAIALETGEIDLIYGPVASPQMGIETFRRLEATGRFASDISGPRATQSLALNSGRGPTAERAVRRALQHLTNKDMLIEAIYLGMERRADFLFDPAVPYCDTGLDPYSYDVAKGEALLDEAGWKMVEGKPFREKNGEELLIDICFVGNNPAHKAIAEALQGELRRSGVGLRLIGEEHDSFYRRQKDGDFGMIFNNTWGAPYEPHAMVSSMLVPAHADYQAQAGLPMKAELDEAIQGLFSVTDEDTLRKMYRDILTTIHEEAVYLPLTHNTMLRMHAKELEGVEFSPLRQIVPFERMYWKK